MEHGIFNYSNELSTSHHLSLASIDLVWFGLLSLRELCQEEHICIRMRFFAIMSLMFRTNVLHLNFCMCILDLTSILLKLLYHVSRTVIPLEDENVGNKNPKFWKNTSHALIFVEKPSCQGCAEVAIFFIGDHLTIISLARFFGVIIPSLQ